MEEIKLTLNKAGKGGFYMSRDGRQIGEMVLEVKGDHMTVFHTEVKEEEEGKGYAKRLFEEMVKHARGNHLKVTAVCPYVRAQFMRHKQNFADIWNRDEDED
jgi:uncharacterized protein